MVGIIVFHHTCLQMNHILALIVLSVHFFMMFLHLVYSVKCYDFSMLGAYVAKDLRVRICEPDLTQTSFFDLAS
uniref:Uncharacterized protein n=1 Tax=Arundo donax TaxID=35708 RepID=A0A0A9FEU6_ARUDO